MKLVVTVQDDEAKTIDIEIETKGLEWDDQHLRLGSLTARDLVVPTLLVVGIRNVEAA